MALSALILKNLDDSKKYIDSSNNIYNTTQALILSQNLKSELFRLYKKLGNDFDSVINSKTLQQDLELELKDRKIFIKQITTYNPTININDIKSKDIDTKELVSKFFESKSLNNYYILEAIINKNQKVETYRQLNKMIYKYIQQVNETDILTYINEIGFFDITDEMRLVSATLGYTNSKLEYSSSFILDLKREKVIDFDFIIK